ncbi:MAG: stage III sporulation protein AB [Defluviitaleaceae bacterium]|nr:stage III sporulation protein AB [Defluviitaleaceae bacterium]MCL2264070.1 stage III sporulation protein AB [Defluviitaleaceae bacterium]
MLIRIAGTLLVMAGSVGLGMYFSAKESFRVQDLLEFKKALLILSSEIEYMRSTLADACENIAKRTSHGVSQIFERFSQLLSEGEGETAYQLWLEAMETNQDTTNLAREDRTVLEDFGKTLGYLDKQMQKNAIDYAVSYIDEKAAALAASSAKNKRMYQSLGVIGGLLITVVLW